ncbi:LLM class flavin-dependent oxidoreductase [Aciduricibacillus chroicocephali]|uniref:LLM class flavin-dependent oxidoreductase n=1 Tax=Aciduricibacillus chroicocephali TaxID=3054939 RepID=A0ABY9KXD0_9BACI|nr:LLM class flavin-dependent oxidoreductase [Bacillaceae bacterium 44XB]
MSTKSSGRIKGVPLSILDLAPLTEGGSASETFRNSVDLAQHAQNWGYGRYWLAEHHNMPGIASSATSIVIGHIAGATESIRVGAGGIMLPNHAALTIAEQFGTLNAMYPGRIDLGLGRAPGTDSPTSHALRRTLNSGPEDFPLQVEELEDYFAGTSRVQAIPGKGEDIPIWFLGSSGFSAKLAAGKGAPFAFASHFSPRYTIPALNVYRDNFKPSERLDKPHALVCLNVIAADTDEEAQFISTSLKLQFWGLRRGTPFALKPPITQEELEALWSPYERQVVEAAIDSFSTIIGSPDTVKHGIERFIEETKADELMLNSVIYDHKARLRSYEIVHELMD